MSSWWGGGLRGKGGFILDRRVDRDGSSVGTHSVRMLLCVPRSLDRTVESERCSGSAALTRIARVEQKLLLPLNLLKSLLLSCLPAALLSYTKQQMEDKDRLQ